MCWEFNKFRDILNTWARKRGCSQTTHCVCAFATVHWRVKTSLSVYIFPHFSCPTCLNVAFYPLKPGPDLPFDSLMPVSRDFAQTVKTHERSTWEVQDYWVPGPKTHTFLFWVCHHHLWHKMCFRLGTSNLDSASSDQIMGGLILIWFLIKAQFILKNNIWTGWMDYRMLQRHLVNLFYFLNKEEQKCSGFCVC